MASAEVGGGAAATAGGGAVAAGGGAGGGAAGGGGVAAGGAAGAAAGGGAATASWAQAPRFPSVESPAIRKPEITNRATVACSLILVFAPAVIAAFEAAGPFPCLAFVGVGNHGIHLPTSPVVDEVDHIERVLTEDFVAD